MPFCATPKRTKKKLCEFIPGQEGLHIQRIACAQEPTKAVPHNADLGPSRFRAQTNPELFFFSSRRGVLSFEKQGKHGKEVPNFLR